MFQENDKNFVDFCIKNPFLKLLDGMFVPVNIKWIDDLLWISLYYKIADCYDNKEDFYHLFGYLFENYVGYLTEKRVNIMKADTNIYHNFHMESHKKNHQMQ